MKPTLNVGLIGHRFMGKAHSHVLRDVSMFFDLEAAPVMKVICGLEDDLPQVAAKYGWERFEKSWQKVIADPEIDVIAIASPGAAHRDIAVAAARAGKHVFCEKPLAASLSQAREMLAAAEQYGIRHMVDFNYRAVPAIRLARQLIAEGRLGKLYHFRGSYMQDWALSPEFPLVWRMRQEMVGPGPAEAGSHVVDLARYLVGEFSQVAAADAIFIGDRALPERPAEKSPVTTDDLAVWVARFDNGALGVFEASRVIAGRRNALTFEVNGSRGSLRFDLERLNELDVFLADDAEQLQGFRTILVTQASHPYLSAWWPAGHIIGWEHTFVHQYREFFQAIAKGCPPSPGFQDGVRAQQVIETVARAAAGSRWEVVSE